MSNSTPDSGVERGNIHYGGLGAVLLAIPLLTLLQHLDAPGWLALPAMLVGATIWVYSPLPNHNGSGPMHAGDRGTYWGWSNDE
jgi:hypothetical protein